MKQFIKEQGVTSLLKKTCKLKGVISKTCVSDVNDLAVIILSEVEKNLYFVAARYTDVYLLSSRERIVVCDRGLLRFQLTQLDCWFLTGLAGKRMIQ